MSITESFINDFKPSYLRNNRRGGQKNIRCFPACSHDGHKCAGFCGQAVKLVVSTTTTLNTNLVAVAEFVQVANNKKGNIVDKKAKSATTKIKSKKDVAAAVTAVTSSVTTTTNQKSTKESPHIQVGTSLPSQYLHDNVRIKKDPLRRFIKGNKVMEDFVEQVVESPISSSTYEFLPTCWHYSWRSNKHSTNKQHCLRVYLFAPQEEENAATATMMMKCIDVYDSPSFSLFSSKQLDNYAKEGNIPNGAIALFRARQKASAEKLFNKLNGNVKMKSNAKKRKEAMPMSKSSVLKKRKSCSLTKIHFGGSSKHQKIKSSDPMIVSFPYDVMIADCLGIERVTSLPKDEINSWGAKTNIINSKEDIADMLVVDDGDLSLDIFDLGNNGLLKPGGIKKSSSFTTLNGFDVGIDDCFTSLFNINNINVIKNAANVEDLYIDYSSETSESSQESSILHTSSEDDESESDLDALWY